MKMTVLAVLAAAAVVAAAAILSSPDARSDVAVLEIGGDGRVELVPVDAGAAGPESLAFDGGGGGPYAGASSGGSPASGGGKSTRPPARRNCTYTSPHLLVSDEWFRSFFRVPGMRALQSGSLLPCDLLCTLLASCALAPSLQRCSACIAGLTTITTSHSYPPYPSE